MASKISGIVPIFKPKHKSSIAVVSTVKNILEQRYWNVKVGQSGTLDTAAEGLLILGIGNATQHLTHTLNFPKTYITRISLGKMTDSLDTIGTVIEEKPFVHVTEEAVRQTLPSFLGTISQVPPAFSSLKVYGVCASDLTRCGAEVTLSPRTVNVYNIDLLAFCLPDITIKVHSGRGMYVRSLARDISASLGTVGHIQDLCRSEYGPFSLSDPQTLHFDQVSDETLHNMILPGDILAEYAQGCEPLPPQTNAQHSVFFPETYGTGLQGAWEKKAIKLRKTVETRMAAMEERRNQGLVPDIGVCTEAGTPAGSFVTNNSRHTNKIFTKLGKRP